MRHANSTRRILPFLCVLFCRTGFGHVSDLQDAVWGQYIAPTETKLISAGLGQERIASLLLPQDGFSRINTEENKLDQEAPLNHRPEFAQNPIREAGEWNFFVIPSINFTTDEGLGAGLSFAFFRKEAFRLHIDEEFRVRLFMSSRFSHQHELSWLVRNLGGLPLRMHTRVGFFSTRSAHFCGLGPEVTCSLQEAFSAYRDLLALGGAEGLDAPWTRDEFLRRYYLRRYFLPYFRFLMLWKFFSSWPVEFLFGWDLAYEQPGAPNEQFPFPNNRYSEYFPNGEAGRHSTMRVGIFSENIDVEAWPSQGYRALLVVRAAHTWSGSSWQFFGIHADVIGYVRFPNETSNVWAMRLLYDEIQGRVPTRELSQVTGLQDVSAFGGPWLGRGIRERRFNGHQKMIHQGEYRVPVATLRLSGHQVGFALASFYDLAWIHFEPQTPVEFQFADESERVLFGLGMGIRLLFDRVFLFRVDVAASPQERLGPFLYAVMGTPF